jgi:hypothetical protein
LKIIQLTCVERARVTIQCLKLYRMVYLPTWTNA